MITAKKLDSITALDVQVRRLYETAFPIEEQIPYEDLMVLMDKMPLDFTAYYEGEKSPGLPLNAIWKVNSLWMVMFPLSS